MELSVRENISKILSDCIKASISQGSQNALADIKEIFECLKKIVIKDKNYKLPRQTLLKLIKLGQKERQLKQNQMKNMHMVDPNQFNFAKAISKFALNVYGISYIENFKHVVATVMGLDNIDDTLYTYFKAPDGPTLFPDFVILRDRKSSSIVLVIRGTFDRKDVLIDLNCKEAPFLDGVAHGGILTGARNILEKAGPILKNALQENPTYHLIITGHSLGAGTAILATMCILSGESETVDSTKVKCIALAPPPVYRSEMTIPANFTDNIEIYIHNNDCVPSLSFGVIAKLAKSMQEVSDLNFPIYQVFTMRAEWEFPTTQENVEIIAAALDNINKNEKINVLNHPGRVFYFHHDPNAGYQLFCPAGESFSNELILERGLFLDHAQQMYRNAFSNVQIDQ